ncbi:MAG TPA: CDP-alcohol phosphatidyltransferase family protein [Elusimicrobiota bacterium]|nr:CDP-alcohol phosphatidyltransferase family protein [Elusimicrobiota bacterium]
MGDYQQLISSYPAEKRAWDRTYPWISGVARPLSFPLSWLFRKAGLRADHVTLMTAILGVLSMAGLSTGHPSLMIVGGGCLLAYNILDCVDGNLARAWPVPGAPVGKFWDQLVGNFYGLSYLFLGIGLGERSSLVMGALVTAEKLLIHSIRNIFWSVLGPRWEQEKTDSGRSTISHAGRWYYAVFYNLVDLQAHTVLLPVCLLFGLGPLFLAVSLAAAAGELAITLGLYLRRSFRLRRNSPGR